LLFTKTAVIIGLLYNYLPFMVIPIFATLHRFNFALIDAASDLGASKIKSFLTITFPMSWPGIITGCILVFTPTFGEFIVPDLLGGAKNLMLGNLIKMQFLETRDWPFGAALTVVATVIALSIIVIFQRVIVKKWIV